MTEIHQAVWRWVRQYPGWSSLAYNFGAASDDNAEFIPMAGDRLVKKDILGNELRHYDFAISAFKRVSDIEDDDNVENLVDYNAMQAFIDWLESKHELRDFPNLGAGCRVRSVHALQNIPTVAFQQGDMAKYLIQARIEYVKEI